MSLPFLNLMGHILRGSSLARALMFEELRRYSVLGKAVDLGGGRNPAYHFFMRILPGASISVLDPKHSDKKRIDFEREALPYDDASVDTVLVFNVLEHLYNYHFFIKEIARVISPSGKVMGFVPFLVNYHPDPHDYFRYTKESIKMAFSYEGFTTVDVREVGGGPLLVNFNNLVLSMPLAARLILFPVYYFFDSVLVRLRPHLRERFPLGYMFVCNK